MEQPIGHDEFTHVRIILGMVVGLSVARLLTGLARFVQHPGQARVYGVHLGWVAFMLLSVLHFWWFEYGLTQVRWTFVVYVFTAFYAALFFFTCAVLMPDSLDDYAGLESYFQSRRGWFFGLLAGLVGCDLVDTAIKGAAYFRGLGPEYPLRQGAMLLGAVVAARVPDRRLQAAFVAFAVISEIALILGKYRALG